MPTVPGGRPHSLIVAADNIVLGVNGLGRGVRFDGVTVAPIGITQPKGLTAATSMATTGATYNNATLYYSVLEVVVEDGGANYYTRPTVTIAGVSGAAATVSNGAVDSIAITTSATTHTTNPTVVISGGQGGPWNTGIQGVGLLRGGVNNVQVNAGTALYAVNSPPAVTFTAATGVSEVRAAKGYAVLNASGPLSTSAPIASIVITDSGHYETTSAFNVTATSTGGSTYYIAASSTARPVLCSVTGGATLVADFSGVVTGATVLTGGDGNNYAVPPAISLRSLGPTKAGEGAAADAQITNGKLTGLSVTQYGGGYDGLVEAVVTQENATAIAVMQPRLAGKYLCGVRFRDGAPYNGGDTLCGDMSELLEIDCGEGVNQIIWDLNGLQTADSSPSRLSTVELWRTTADQATTLYRVAIIQLPISSAGLVNSRYYIDELSDDELTREDRGQFTYIDSLSITSGGSGYFTAPSISFSGGGGSGAKAEAYVASNSVVSARITERGAGYSSAPSVTISAPPTSQATATATVSDGTITAVVRVVAGAGYTSPPAVTITGDGVGATATAILYEPTGAVAAFLVTNAGSGYTSATVSVAAPPAASTATATAVLGTQAVYAALPILTVDGYPSAQAHGIPPSTMSIVRQFQDRAWYSGDVSGREPNAIYFSQPDLPESVPESNQIVIQQAGVGRDAIKALVPLDSSLYVCQSSNIYRLTVVGNPLESATSTPVAQRGALNDRCWDTFDGVAYIADSRGLYAFDGGRAEPLSDPISTFWSDGVIDFNEQYSKWYFVHVDASQKVVRFYYKGSTEAGFYPKNALCYSLITRAWWVEQYAHSITSAASVRNAGVAYEILGSTSGALHSSALGVTDNGSPISYAIRTGNLPLSSDPKRAVALTYSPTNVSHQLNTSVYYNGSQNARVARSSADVGTGFKVNGNDAAYTLDLALNRSPLAASVGEAELVLSVNTHERAVGGDKNMAVRLWGTQAPGGDRAVVHRMRIEGAG